MCTLTGRGINQPDLIAALAEIKTKWNATMAKLDLDAGVAAVDYASTCGLTSNRAVVEAKGIGQDDIVSVINDAVTKINACNAKLDADALTGSDYAALWNLSNTKVFSSGMYQGDLIKLLYTIKTNINGILAKLDADIQVGDTNYAATNPISFAIDIAGC